MRVVIAEDQALLRERLVALLREQGIDVVAQVEDGDGLLRVVNGHKPDLVHGPSVALARDPVGYLS